MNNLTKKDAVFTFGINCKEAFKELKHRLITAPVLTFYDLEHESILETDASDFVISVILTQKGQDRKKRPIAYYSRKMT
jgi:hypothetical protein